MKNVTKSAKASMFSLSEKEIRMMIDSADNIRDRLIIELLAFTGARRKELVLIRVKDLDLQNDRIYVPTVKRRCDPFEALRPVPIIDARLKQDLKFYLERWKEKYGLREDHRLIQHCSRCSKNGISSVRINQIVADVARKAKIVSPNPNRKHVHPHLFRHSFVRFARKYGLDFKVIQEIVGHASIATTFDMYGSPSWDEIRDETQGKMADFAKN
jgi:integrase/recombinase XerC